MRGLIYSVLPVLASCSPMVIDTVHHDAAPILSASNAESVEGHYIVKFKDHVSETAAADHHSWVQDIHLSSETERTELRKRSQYPVTADIFEGIKHTYNIAGGFLGYSGNFDDSVIEKLRRHPDVSIPLLSSVLPPSRACIRQNGPFQALSLVYAYRA
jgi:cerevisin